MAFSSHFWLTLSWVEKKNKILLQPQNISLSTILNQSEISLAIPDRSTDKNQNKKQKWLVLPWIY